MSWENSIILCSPVQCCSTQLKIAAAFHSRDGSFLRTKHFCTQGTCMIRDTVIYHHLSICKVNRFAIFPQTESCPSHTASMFLVNTLRPPPPRLEQLHFNSCIFNFISTPAKAVPCFSAKEKMKNVSGKILEHLQIIFLKKSPYFV